jgi:hypothetical protein
MKEDEARRKAADIERLLRARDTSMGIIYQETAVSIINIVRECETVTNYDELIAQLNQSE